LGVPAPVVHLVIAEGFNDTKTAKSGKKNLSEGPWAELFFTPGVG